MIANISAIICNNPTSGNLLTTGEVTNPTADFCSGTAKSRIMPAIENGNPNVKGQIAVLNSESKQNMVSTGAMPMRTSQDVSNIPPISMNMFASRIFAGVHSEYFDFYVRTSHPDLQDKFMIFH